MSMKNLAVRAAFNQTAQHFRHLGLEVPKKLTAELDSLAALDNSRNLAADRRALGDAVADALIAGNDPATDTKVQALMFRQQLATDEMRGMVKQILEERRSATLAKHAPTIIETMRPLVEQADETLAAYHEQIPNVSLTDVNAVTVLKPNQMPLWGQAREAVEQVHRIGQVWTLVVTAAELARVDLGMRPLILADLTADELNALGRGTDTDAAAHAGHRLSLATPDEFRGRVKAIETERQRRELETQERHQTASFAGRSR